MNPSGTYGWGRSAWALIHGMTLDPLARRQQKVAQKRLLYLLQSVLPCPSCRISYQSYCNKSLASCELPFVGDYACQIHDRVNLKLEKEACSYPSDYWKLQQVANFEKGGWDSYVEDMWYFLFTLAANYPAQFALDTRVRDNVRAFFQTLPLALEHRPWGQYMKRYLQTHPLHDSVMATRKDFMQWLYEMYANSGLTASEVQSLEVIQRTMESIRYSNNN